MTDAVDRRALLTLGTVVAAGAALPAHAQETEAQHMKSVMAIPPDAPGIAMLIHPKMVAQDLIGPMTVFSFLRCRIDLVWKDMAPVSTDVGIPFAATQTFAETRAILMCCSCPAGSWVRSTA